MAKKENKKAVKAENVENVENVKTVVNVLIGTKDQSTLNFIDMSEDTKELAEYQGILDECQCGEKAVKFCRITNGGSWDKLPQKAYLFESQIEETEDEIIQTWVIPGRAWKVNDLIPKNKGKYTCGGTKGKSLEEQESELLARLESVRAAKAERDARNALVSADVEKGMEFLKDLDPEAIKKLRKMLK